MGGEISNATGGDYWSTADIWEGWSALGQRVYDFLVTDAHFEGVHPDVLLLERVRLKGRKFNSLNNRGAAPEVMQQRQLAQDIHDYKRQSDGF